MQFTKRFRVRVYTYWLTGTSKFCITNAAKKSRNSFQANSWWSQVRTTKLPCLWNDAKAGIVPQAWTTSLPTSGGSEAAIQRLRQKLICLKTWRKWGGQRYPNQLRLLFLPVWSTCWDAHPIIHLFYWNQKLHLHDSAPWIWCAGMVLSTASILGNVPDSIFQS